MGLAESMRNDLTYHNNKRKEKAKKKDTTDQVIEIIETLREIVTTLAKNQEILASRIERLESSTGY